MSHFKGLHLPQHNLNPHFYHLFIMNNHKFHPRTTTKSQLFSYQTPHPPILDLNEPTRQHLGDWEDQIQSYTELLSGPYVNLDEHQNQQHLVKPPQEHQVVGLPDEVFDPFSEDEDDILAAANDHETEDLDVQQTNNEPREHNSTYVPPEHFLHFSVEPAIYDPEFGHAFDRDTVVYPSGTLFVGQWFNTKEETQYAINCFHIVNHCMYKVAYSTQSRLIVQCVHNDCAWRCRAILCAKNRYCEIMKLEGVHPVCPL